MDQARNLESTLIFIFQLRRMGPPQSSGTDTMLVCHCRGVSDRQIRRAVKNGACSLREVARETGAGMRCGGCRTTVSEVVAEAMQSEIRPTSVATLILGVATER